MWILKGAFLGLWLFGYGSLAFLYFALFRGLPRDPGRAMAVSLVTSRTTENVGWWVAGLACIAIGFALVRSWHGKSSVILWVVLLVTSIIPVGWFGFIAFVIFKGKAIAAGAGH